MEPTATRSPWSGVELLERALGYTRSSLALVTPALMDAPTPCTGWDVEDLLAHMHDSLESLHEAGAVRRVGLTPAPAASGDLVEAIRARACDLLATWSAALSGQVVSVDGRQVTSSVLTSAGALEVTVHGWDLAVACGVRRPIPPALAADLMRIAPLLVTEADRPRRFAPALPVSERAPAADRLLAHLGRDPRG